MLSSFRHFNQWQNMPFALASQITASLVTPNQRDQSDYRSRRAKIIYQFQPFDGNSSGFRALELSDDKEAMWSVDSAVMHALFVPSVGKAPRLTLPGDYKHPHDLRAFSYCLGVACASGLRNLPIIPNIVAPISTPNDGLATFEAGDLIISNGLAATANEQHTLAILAHQAGCHAVRLHNGRVAQNGVVLDGTNLAAYAVRVLLNILADDQANAHGSHNAFAFARGLSSLVTLRSHCDEGGFTRNCFRNAAYPASGGLITSNAPEFNKMSCCSIMPNEMLARFATETFLKAVASVVNSREVLISEDGVGVLPLLCTKPITITENATAYNIPNLVNATDNIFSQANTIFSTAMNMNNSGVAEANIVRGAVYAAADPHLLMSNICPGAWVEVSGIQMTDMSPAYSGGFHIGCNIKLPMIKSNNYASNAYPEGLGAVTDFEVHDSKFREHGIHYFFSRAFSDGPNSFPNGLGYIRQAFPLNTMSRYAANAGADASLALARWNTPHNPMPSDFEGHHFDSYGAVRVFLTEQNINNLPSMETFLKGSVTIHISPLTSTSFTDHTIITVRSHITRYNKHYAAAMRIERPDTFMWPTLAPSWKRGWTCCEDDNEALYPETEEAAHPSHNAPDVDSQNHAVLDDDDDDSEELSVDAAVAFVLAANKTNESQFDEHVPAAPERSAPVEKENYENAARNAERDERNEKNAARYAAERAERENAISRRIEADKARLAARRADEEKTNFITQTARTIALNRGIQAANFAAIVDALVESNPNFADEKDDLVRECVLVATNIRNAAHARGGADAEQQQ